MESIVTTLGENLSQFNVTTDAYRLNGDLRALALVYSVELPVIPHPQLASVLHQLLVEIEKVSGIIYFSLFLNKLFNIKPIRIGSF